VAVMAADTELWRVWREAASRSEVGDRLRGLLDEINQQVDESGFTCQQSGRCCKFESFGHRLYMTGLEVAWFRSLAGPPPAKASAGSVSVSLPVLDPKQDGCPYQVDGGCSVHGDRPFACRVFFCQEGSDDWQVEKYEAFQLEMKRLHEELGLPYRYMEWRQGLADAEGAGL
jgi:Fe-S-cluster containining protein